MMDIIFLDAVRIDIDYRRKAAIIWWLWFCTLIGFTALTALFMLYVVPVPLPIGALIFGGTLVAICYEPRWGLYAVVFFALVGDSALLPWYPFTKNLSSPESLLYLNSALIFSPFELYVALVLGIWLGAAAMKRHIQFYKGALLLPVAFFLATIVFGFIHGVVRGGNLNIALWEVRPIFYLLIVFILTSNLLNRREHINQLFWLIMIALFIEGLVGSYHYIVVLGGNLMSVEAITEHAAAIHMNTLFVAILGAHLYGASFAKRMVLPLMALPVLLTYIATQRRAAFIALGVASVGLAILLYQRNRQRFWQIAPVALILLIGYIGVFWHSNGALGLPAQAVKSVLAPDEGSADYQSNFYRVIENLNISYTIHKSPIFGVGFGNKFHIIVPMPDISFFIWWEYFVHNSIFWLWVKAGVFGFAAMLFLICLSIMTGVQTVLRLRDSELQVITLTATLYILMHFLYAYVDMSWDTQSMVYIGTALGMINCVERVATRPLSIEGPQR